MEKLSETHDVKHNGHVKMMVYTKESVCDKEPRTLWVRKMKKHGNAEKIKFPHVQIKTRHK